MMTVEERSIALTDQAENIYRLLGQLNTDSRAVLAAYLAEMKVDLAEVRDRIAQLENATHG